LNQSALISPQFYSCADHPVDIPTFFIMAQLLLIIRKGTARTCCSERVDTMSLFVKHARDIAYMDLVGRSLFRLFVKAPENLRAPGKVYSWHEGNDGTAIGYEASWAGIFPHPGK
jgi:hypothetical protein